MKIETKNLPDDLAGEVLRFVVFRHSHYYFSLSALRPDFVESVTPRSDLYPKLNDYMNDECDIYSAYWYVSPTQLLEVIMQFDGDSTLIIIDNGMAYVNLDGKKDHNWKKINP
jgi:hypothetical protein